MVLAYRGITVVLSTRRKMRMTFSHMRTKFVPEEHTNWNQHTHMLYRSFSSQQILFRFATLVMVNDMTVSKVGITKSGGVLGVDLDIVI